MNWGLTLAPIAMASFVGCAPRARMCVASSECASMSACVAGRCQAQGEHVVAAASLSERLVFQPIDVAYLRRGEGPDDVRDAWGVSSYVLGSHDARLLLRFAVDLPKDANVVEAYVVLHRDDATYADPVPLLLHADRVTEPWDGRQTSWVFSPRLSDVKLPDTRVEPGGPVLVRLDVRELVRNWPRRDPSDRGLAIVAENETSTGVAFASSRSKRPNSGPYLEIYVRHENTKSKNAEPVNSPHRPPSIP